MPLPYSRSMVTNLSLRSASCHVGFGGLLRAGIGEEVQRAHLTSRPHLRARQGETGPLSRRTSWSRALAFPHSAGQGMENSAGQTATRIVEGSSLRCDRSCGRNRVRQEERDTTACLHMSDSRLCARGSRTKPSLVPWKRACIGWTHVFVHEDHALQQKVAARPFLVLK